MPANLRMERCISQQRGALVFCSPESDQPRPGARVQIIDVFSLQVATGFTRDPQGRLLLESQASVAAGRSWSLAKATQLIRNDARPHRWVGLQLDKRAWGLFWAGGGLQRCRELLADRVSDAEACSALVPVTPDALLRLVLDVGADPAPAGGSGSAPQPWRPARVVNPWRIVAWTSLAWLAVWAATVAGFLAVLERQDRKLELLLERTAPARLEQ
jgi:hypothetical protein